MPPDGAALAYDLDDASRVCGLSRDSLKRAVKSGDLPAKRSHRPKDPNAMPTGKILILRRDLEAFLENLPDDWWGYRF
ncbi:helix-turn-helix domain-containing protein [Nocardioides korecus]